MHSWRSLVLGIQYEEDGNRLVRREQEQEQEQEMKQETLTSIEKSMNVALSDTAGKSAGQSKIPFDNGQVEIRSTSGVRPGSGPALFLSQIELAENPIFDSSRTSRIQQIWMMLFEEYTKHYASWPCLCIVLI